MSGPPKKNNIHITLTGEAAQRSPIAAHARQQLANDLNKHPTLHQEIIMQGTALAVVSAQDWERSSYLILKDIQPSEKNTSQQQQITEQFLSSTDWENYKVLEQYGQTTIEKQKSYEERIPAIALLIKGLMVDAGISEADVEKNPYYYFLINYANQSGLIPMVAFPLLEKLPVEGINRNEEKHISLLVPNNKSIDIVYLEKANSVFPTMDTGSTLDISDNPFFYQATLRIHLDRPFNADCLEMVAIEALIPDTASVRQTFPHFHKTACSVIQPPKKSSELDAPSFCKTPSTLFQRTKNSSLNKKPRKGAVIHTPCIDMNAATPIKDHTSLIAAIAYRFEEANGSGLTQEHKQYLEALQPALRELTTLKNTLQEESGKVGNSKSDYAKIVKEKCDIINRLCGTLADQIVADLANKGPLDKKQRQQLCHLLKTHTENVLNSKTIKKDNGSTLSRIISTTLRGVVSIFATLAMVPLAIPYVRHSLFRNKAGRVLNEVRHEFKNISKQP